MMIIRPITMHETSVAWNRAKSVPVSSNVKAGKFTIYIKRLNKEIKVNVMKYVAKNDRRKSVRLFRTE
jgi:hypothetical protein